MSERECFILGSIALFAEKVLIDARLASCAVNVESQSSDFNWL